MLTKKLNGTVIVTYRCNARCTMCSRYKAPSRPEEELSIETIRKLPEMYFTNITGGEPFVRKDLKEIVRELYKKSDRIVISTNGFFTDRIIDLCREFPQIGIRISIEGFEKTNNAIRGLEDGFNRGYETLKKLRLMGMKDVGFGMTVQDCNAPDLVPLYRLSDEMNMEFATASLHNSFYFVETKNIIHDRPMVAQHFEDLVNELLKSSSPKKWFRAYFNHGLINYIYSQKRLLPCDMSFDTFFIDPYGDVMPCNGTKEKLVMGNLNVQTWDELWNSDAAETVRAQVRCCDRNCWMIGSVSPAMHKYILKPACWVVWHKFLCFWKKKKYSMYENKIVRDYRDGRVSKEELDRCSTCDLCAETNDGCRTRAPCEQKKKMIILTNCLTDATDEGSVKVATSLAMQLKRLCHDAKLISYGENHPLCDYHVPVKNKLMLSVRLIRQLRCSRDTVLYLPFPAKFLAMAVRTFVVSVFARRRLLLLLPMRSPKIGRMARLLMWFSGARLIVLSDELRRDYEKLFPARVAYVHAGVDTQKFTPEPESRLRLRAKYSVPEDKPVVLHVGHLKEGRNIGTLLSLDERFYVVLVASPRTAHEWDEALRKRLSDRGNITIIDDFIPNIQDIYRMADVYYFPVENEKHCISTPLSVLEAAACGLPVVCTRFSELKQFEGEEGFYFIDSFEPEHLNAQIDRAIRDGRSGRASVRRYDWALAAKAIVDMDQKDFHASVYSDVAKNDNMDGGE